MIYFASFEIGNLVDVKSSGTRQAMTSSISKLGSRLTGTLVDHPSPEAYPILGYSYFIIRVHGMMDCSMAIELAR